MTNQANMATGAWGQQLAGGAGTGVSNAVNPALVQSLQAGMTGPSNTQQVYKQMMGGDPNAMYVDPAIKMAQGDVARNLQENILPEVSDRGIAAGQLGSSRNQIDKGMALREAQKLSSDISTGMRAENWNTDLQNKLRIAELADQNQLRTREQALGLISGQNTAAQYGLGAGQSMQGMQFNPQMAPWQIMSQYANTLGAPTVLGNMSTNASSKGAGGGGGLYG
jgi:hypothetical protein